MKELNLRNVTIMAAVAMCFIQIGAQLFALTVVASTVSAAPPRSFAILEGEYRYDSGAFWSIIPPFTFLLLIVALLANWKTARRNLILFAVAIFIVAGLAAGLYLEPVFDEMKAIGFLNEIDPALQSRARTWYILDWAVWSLGALAGVALILALIRPASNKDRT
ncbi:MAG TPA: hypothetical protein VJV05_14950 [Pyrinomonadaceae bacterium]|nr:hypothetical protein [Pyrinomonadaceae bacterium]